MTLCKPYPHPKGPKTPSSASNESGPGYIQELQPEVRGNRDREEAGSESIHTGAPTTSLHQGLRAGMGIVRCRCNRIFISQAKKNKYVSVFQIQTSLYHNS